MAPPPRARSRLRWIAPATAALIIVVEGRNVQWWLEDREERGIP
jgi:hypothetical protein